MVEMISDIPEYITQWSMERLFVITAIVYMCQRVMKRTRVQKDREYTFINDDTDWEELLNQHNSYSWFVYVIYPLIWLPMFILWIITEYRNNKGQYQRYAIFLWRKTMTFELFYYSFIAMIIFMGYLIAYDYISTKDKS